MTNTPLPTAPLTWERLVAAPWVDASMADALPATAGAYLLALKVTVPTPLPPRFAVHPPLPPGWYIYAGSARGPGGLRARLRRHLKATGSRRWHVDWVTTQATTRLAHAWPDGVECTPITLLLAATPSAQVVVPGFGSSDCPRCPAHLLALPDALAEALHLPRGTPSCKR